MKRSMIIAAALCLSLLSLSGCDRSPAEDTDELQQSAPSQNQPVDPVPVQTEPVSPSPDADAEREMAEREPIYQIPSGIWLAETDMGYSNYYYFNAEDQSGSYVSLDYGLGMPFSYDGSGTDLVFQMAGTGAGCAATLEPAGETAFTLVWADSLPETLTFVGEGTLEEFHFFSNDELAKLAMDHYIETTDLTPGQSGSMTNEDNTVTVQLYDNLGDHNSTAAWYIVDRFTAVGTNLLTGEPVDLLAEPEEEPTVEEQPVVEDTLPEGELPAEDEVPPETQLPTYAEMSPAQ